MGGTPVESNCGHPRWGLATLAGTSSRPRITRTVRTMSDPFSRVHPAVTAFLAATDPADRPDLVRATVGLLVALADTYALDVAAAADAARAYLEGDGDVDALLAEVDPDV